MTPRRLLFLVMAFLLVTRLPALLHPKAFDDEQVYAVVARQMIGGGQPYRDAIEGKPPLLFACYRAIFQAAGERNWPALHVTALAWTTGTMVALYLIARRLWNPATGVWAAFLYALFMAWGDYRSLAFNGELLMNLPVTVALAVTFGGTRSALRLELVLVGMTLATACLLKQPSAIAALPIVLYVMRRDYRQPRGLRLAHSFLHAALVGAGFATMLGVAALVLWRAGILADALYWTLLVQPLPPGVIARRFVENGPAACAFFVFSTLPLLLGAGASLGQGWRRQQYWTGRRAEFAAIGMLLGVSAIGVGFNGQFTWHYFLQLMPALALLAAPVFAESAEGQPAARLPLPRPRAVRLWLAATACVFLIVDTVGLARNRGLSEAARYVKAHSTPDDRFFVWGQGDRQTGMYLDADRLPASRYIATFPLTGHFFGRVRPDEWENLERDFARHPPRFIVDTDGIDRPSMYPLAQYPFMRTYVRDHYHEVYRAADGTVYASGV